MTLNRILLTGAGGNLGRELRRRLTGRFALLRLSDIGEMDAADSGQEVVRCDLGDAAAVQALCANIDAIIHLGGQSVEADWPTVLNANISGAINLWEGARLNGVRRILFASSNHVIGLYRRTMRLDHVVPPRPDSRYGTSKAFGEDLAAYYAYKHGIRAFCMRIGSCFERPLNERMLSTWLSFPDFERLIEVGLRAEYLFEVVYGQSRNHRAWWDNSNAYRLGFDPQDNAEAFAGDLVGQGTENDLDNAFQGGQFVSPDFSGDVDLL